MTTWKTVRSVFIKDSDSIKTSRLEGFVYGFAFFAILFFVIMFLMGCILTLEGEYESVYAFFKEFFGLFDGAPEEIINAFKRFRLW